MGARFGMPGFLARITDHLNRLDTKLQRKGKKIMDIIDHQRSCLSYNIEIVKAASRKERLHTFRAFLHGEKIVEQRHNQWRS